MKKRLLCLSIAAALLASVPVAAAANESVVPHVSVVGYDASVDYTAQMIECLENGGPYAMDIGSIYEQQRNLKIRDMGLSQYEETHYFETYSTPEEILAVMEEASKPKPTLTPTPETDPPSAPAVSSYSEEDLYWLSRVVFAEGGCDWFPDWVQRDIASVVLNRVSDPRYPNTIKDVIFDPGQYGCVNNGSIYNTPTQKVINNCRYVLENGSTLPSYVIGQSGYPLGPVYKSYYDSVLGTTTYFFSV